MTLNLELFPCCCAPGLLAYMCYEISFLNKSVAVIGKGNSKGRVPAFLTPSTMKASRSMTREPRPQQFSLGHHYERNHQPTKKIIALDRAAGSEHAETKEPWP